MIFSADFSSPVVGYEIFEYSILEQFVWEFRSISPGAGGLEFIRNGTH